MFGSEFKFNLDLTNVEVGNFDVIPAGEYVAQIQKSELVDTKDGTGKYIKTSWKITDQVQNGRVFFSNFNIMNKSDKAVQIGMAQLKSLLMCAGSQGFVLKDPADLVGLECLVKLKIRTSDQYGDQNEVASFKKANSAVKSENIPF